VQLCGLIAGVFMVRGRNNLFQKIISGFPRDKATMLNLTRRYPSTAAATAIGAAFAGSIGAIKLSANDEDHIRFYGLGHQGIASDLRRRNTDFGSGFKGYSEQDKFEYFKQALDIYGKKVGTGHKRIIIPKSILSKESLTKSLGFVPVVAAVPEAGQTTITSYRSPYHLYHIHGHGEYWTMHKDRDAAFTMMLKASKGPKSVAQTLWRGIKGLPHLLTEGAPGLYYYFKGRFTGPLPMVERLKQELSPKYLRRISANDDDYNTIEALQHGNEASRMRKINTEFGSGWRGLVRLPRRFASLFPNWTGFAGTKSQIMESFAQQLEELGKTSPGLRANIIQDIDKWIEASFTGSAFESMVVINPTAIKAIADRKDVSYSKMLKGTIAHERLHQLLAENPLWRNKLAEGSRSLTRHQLRFLQRRQYSYQPLFAEELEAFKFSYGKLKWEKVRGRMYRELKATRDINIMRGRAEATRRGIIPEVKKQIMAESQKLAMRNASLLAHRGGNIHVVPANRSNI
jgi:hypothetical protein